MAEVVNDVLRCAHHIAVGDGVNRQPGALQRIEIGQITAVIMIQGTLDAALAAYWASRAPDAGTTTTGEGKQ